MKTNLLRRLAILVIIINAFAACNKKESVPPAPTSPMISSFSPSSAAAGDQVVITGNNFSTTTTNNIVKFNDVAAAVTNSTTTQITVTVPAGTTSGKVTVTINNQSAVSSADFTELALVTTVAGNGTQGYADGTGTSAQFKHVTDLILDPAGNIYVVDAGNFRVRKITPSGVVTTFAGSGVNQYADGTGVSASFATMLGIAIDGAGNLYIADLGNHRIRKISPSGVVTTLAGSGVPGYADGPAASAEFFLPMGVVADNSGNVYVADAGNNRIRKISSSGIVSTVAGTGFAGFADGPAATAQFYGPMKIKLDISNNLIVLDQTNNRIRKISNTGVVTTIAGNGSGGFADGLAASAQFAGPAGLAIDVSGNIFIGDQSNQRVRKIFNTGIVSTIAGSGDIGYLDGIATMSRFYNPNGLDINSSGIIYVTDNRNHCIRKITP